MKSKILSIASPKKILIFVLALSFISLCGCAGTSTNANTKEDIQKSLDKEETAVYNTDWSPNDTMVAFIKTENQTDNIYVWKVGETQATLIQPAESTTSGFTWAPDSKYFLINVGHMGPGTTTSTLIDTQSLKAVTADIVSLSVSDIIWSPDSKYIALAFDDYAGTKEMGINIFSIDTLKTTNLIKSASNGGFYIVKDWNPDGTITYMVSDSNGNLTEKSIQGPAMQ